MSHDIQEYISQCMVCQKMKYDCTKPYGLLQPLPIPKTPWESIAMDFIFGLPKSQQSSNGIWTIVERFSKQVHFILLRKQLNLIIWPNCS